ncbi:MAG: hypothetical protein ACLP9L_13590 [Thermoguttaceae bacterium]
MASAKNGRPLVARFVLATVAGLLCLAIGCSGHSTANDVAKIKKLANSRGAGQSLVVHFLAVVVLGFPLLMLAGCGKKVEKPPKDFSPVGSWILENSQFVFSEDGQFRREVLGPNPSHGWWRGEWRCEGDIIHAQYTEAKYDVGQEVTFEVIGENSMKASRWGLFRRAPDMMSGPGMVRWSTALISLALLMLFAGLVYRRRRGALVAVP